ncbi:unnamed protein product [Rhizophagus irregularis]|uniref:Transposable element tc3 transposase n=1 Tax=Rhizophagus irregularis TaxID=588596 RepID=A0A916E2J1_9GLOM|nr:unnamed protein product [Rhizophagus irregularis]CAB5351763.1 unnamed protein product [Rhizophagus irregularis]
MKAISLCQRERIFTLLQEGYSSREVAFREKVSHVSVLRIKKKKEKTGHFDVVPRPGRPRILTERHDRNIAKLIKTVRRSLRKQGLVSRVKKRKPLLLKRHRIARKKFAQKYRNWTIEDWHKVVWSDEIKPTVKFGGGSIMIWGCMGAFGVGKYCKIDGRMDGELYREILEEEFLGTLSECDLSVDDVIFQQDNDPKHTANKTYEWFKDNDVEILDWPAQSPDLNPIEHLWNEIDCRLRQLPGNITSKDDLWDKVQLVWNQIDVDFCLKLIDTMPQRIKDVLRAGGGYTEW